MSKAINNYVLCSLVEWLTEHLWDYGNIDQMEIQDKLETLGIIEEVEPRNQKEQDVCDEYDEETLFVVKEEFKAR